MENQASSKNTILNFGVYTGLSSVILTLILYALGIYANPGIAMAIIGIIIPATILVLGIRNFKSKNNGFLTWGQGVKVGVGIALIWGLIAIGFTLLLEQVISPELIEQKLEASRTLMQNFGATEEIIEQEIEKARNQNPFVASSFGLIFLVFIGFVISAIASAIMKKSEEEVY